MRQFGIVNSKLDLSGRRLLDGGTNTVGGSRGEGTKTNPHAENIIRLPVLSSLPANSELPLGAPLFILDQDRIARIVLSVLVGIVLLASGLLMFAGHLLFDFFDLG
jgi:hypothetical protein